MAVLKTLEEAVEFNRPYGTELIVMFAVERSYYESPLLVGDVRIAVEIEVAAILARSKDRVGERGGSRREQELAGRPRHRVQHGRRVSGRSIMIAQIATRNISGATAPQQEKCTR